MDGYTYSVRAQNVHGVGPITRATTGGTTVAPTTLTFTPASQDPIGGVVGTAIMSVTLPMAMGGTAPYTYTITPALPAGLMFDATTRMLSGTPTMAAAAATFTYTAMDGASRAATGSLPFMITVTTVAPTPLTFTPASQDPISGVVGTAIMPVTLPMATGGTAPYTYTITPALPAGLMFDATTRMLSGTPTMAAAAATVTYTAMDGASPAATGSLPFMITVTTVAPPSPKGDTDVASAVTAALMAADSDGDGRWTKEDEPASIPLMALFDGLPETFNAEASSSATIRTSRPVYSAAPASCAPATPPSC